MYAGANIENDEENEEAPNNMINEYHNDLEKVMRKGNTAIS